MPGVASAKAAALFLAVALAAAQATGCSREQPPSGGQASAPAEGGRLALVLIWPGDDFADDARAKTRERVAGLLEERGIGRVVSRGTGMGTDEIVFAVTAPGDVRGAIRGLMFEAAPEIAYVIEDRLPGDEDGQADRPLQTPPPRPQ